MNGTIVIDVRITSDLLSKGKIPKSKNVPLTHIERGDFKALDAEGFKEVHGFKKPDFDETIVLLDKSMERTVKAWELLRDSGYKRLKVYLGGIDDWIKNCGNVRDWNVNSKEIDL